MFSTLFPSQDEKKATVNVYWGHWEGPCLHWILPLGTHTHTHITYGSCVPITQHKAKTHKQTKTRTHALTLAEAKASILFEYEGILSLLRCKSKVMVVIFLAHYIDQCSVNILNILESSQIFTFSRVLCGFLSSPGGSQALQGNLQDRTFHFNSFVCFYFYFLCK